MKITHRQQNSTVVTQEPTGSRKKPQQFIMIAVAFKAEIYYLTLDFFWRSVTSITFLGFLKLFKRSCQVMFLYFDLFKRKSHCFFNGPILCGRQLS